MEIKTTVTAQDLDLEHAELLPNRETLFAFCKPNCGCGGGEGGFGGWGGHGWSDHGGWNSWSNGGWNSWGGGGHDVGVRIHIPCL